MNQDIYVVVEHLRGQVAEITYVTLAAARDLTQAAGGSVVAVLLGHEAQTLADNLAADCVLYADNPALTDFTPEAYRRVLADLLRRDAPRLVLFGDTSIGADVAGALSVQLVAPLVSHCQKIMADGSRIGYMCQICGGKIMAGGNLPEVMTLVTMIPGGYKPEQGQAASAPEVDTFNSFNLDGLRVTLKDYIEPEVGDVDITQKRILVAVGRGIGREDNIELAEELAEALGGVVCASRPVIDQGWLSTARLVGKSGKTVKPAVYLALGISGAPEHTEAMNSSEMIIAINTDPTAPIFDIATYGAVIDLFDLLPVLTDALRKVRSV